MTRNRFQNILQFLHFADNFNYDATDPGRDKLFKVRDIAEFLLDWFKTVYNPSANISIDEELLFYKGRLLFKQYIPSKRARFGIKLFSLCEDSGYLWNSFVYLGKTTINENQHQLERRIGKSGVVVTSLLSDLLGMGYKLFIDNLYTSEALFHYLYENKTCAVETVRKNQLKLPKSVTNKKLGRGQFTFRRKENMLVVRYQDKKDFFFYFQPCTKRILLTLETRLEILVLLQTCSPHRVPCRAPNEIGYGQMKQCNSILQFPGNFLM